MHSMPHIFPNIITILFALGIVAMFALLVVWAIRRRKGILLAWLLTFACMFAGIALLIHFFMNDAYLPALFASFLTFPIPLIIISIIDWYDSDDEWPTRIVLWALAALFVADALIIYFNTVNKTVRINRSTVVTTYQGNCLYTLSDTTLFCSHDMAVDSVFTVVRNNPADTILPTDSCICGKTVCKHYTGSERQLFVYFELIEYH